MEQVLVTIHGTEDNTAGGASARVGYPVEVRVIRGNQTHALLLSMSEATQLADRLKAAREGFYETLTSRD